MNKERTIFLSISLLTALSAQAEICADVVQSIETNQLKVSIRPEFSSYAPREIIRFYIQFENLSTKPLAIPSSAKGLFEEVEVLQKIWQAELKDYAWHSLTDRASNQSPLLNSASVSKERTFGCQTTLRPQVLLMGDKTEILLSNLSEWKAGDADETFIRTAFSDPGRTKYTFHSGSHFSISTEVQVDEVLSTDWRCAVIKSKGDGNELEQCRPVAIVRTKLKSIVLLATLLKEFDSQDEAIFYLDRIKRINKSNSNSPLAGSCERVGEAEDPITFASGGIAIPLLEGAVLLRRFDGTGFKVSPKEYSLKTHPITEQKKQR